MNAHNPICISVSELKKRLDATPHLYLIDVREPYEWQEMRIPNTLHIPKDKLTQDIHQHNIHPNDPIYLFCRGGVRSLYAAHHLLSSGYKEVYSVDGGILAWREAGYPITA